MEDSMDVSYVPNNKEWFGHPKALGVLFGVIMWERFAYYGTLFILVLYMKKYLLEHPDTVIGFSTIRAILQFVFGYLTVQQTGSGDLTVQQISSLIFGLYTGLVYLAPIIGGFLAVAFWAGVRP